MSFIIRFGIIFLLICCVFFPTHCFAWQAPAKEPGKQTPPNNPTAALAALKQAIETGDVVAFANLMAGAPGVTLRKLAVPLKKAQDASAKLDRALAEKPALGLINPFLNDFNPLRGYLFEVVELTKESNQQLARVRIGLANHFNEETLLVTQEDNQWRISLPGEFLKSVKRLTPERLTKQMETLTKLAEIFNKLADDVASGKLATKEAILFKLAESVKEAKLNDTDKSPIKP